MGSPSYSTLSQQHGSQYMGAPMTPSTHVTIDASFFIAPEELRLQFTYSGGRFALSFQSTTLSFAQWRDQASAKLTELLGFQHREQHANVAIRPKQPNRSVASPCFISTARVGS